AVIFIGRWFAGVRLRAVVGVSDVFLRPLFGRAFGFVVDLDCSRRFGGVGGSGFLDSGDGRVGRGKRMLGHGLARFMERLVTMVVIVVIMLVVSFRMIGFRMIGFRMIVGIEGHIALERLRFRRGRAFDDLAADTIAIAAAARIAVARAASVRTVFVLLL